MKKILLILLILTLSLPVLADTVLQGGVDYTVSSARNELLDGISYNINSEIVNGHIYDAENVKNIGFLLKGQTDLKDRTLAYFSDNTYAVLMHSDLYHVYYYSADGVLLYVEKKDGLNYPYKTYKYNSSKKLVNMSLRVSKAETFIYSPDGKLIAHWKGPNAYDEKGNVIMTRKYAE